MITACVILNLVESFYLFPFLFLFIRLGSSLLAACSIAIVSMPKAGIVEQRWDVRLEEGAEGDGQHIVIKKANLWMNYRLSRRMKADGNCHKRRGDVIFEMGCLLI